MLDISRIIHFFIYATIWYIQQPSLVQLSTRLVVVLLEQLIAQFDVLRLGVLLAQTSVDLLLPFVVFGLGLCAVSACPSL